MTLVIFLLIICIVANIVAVIALVSARRELDKAEASLSLARAAVAAERERCAKLGESLDTEGALALPTTGDLCDALAARIRRA